MDNPIVSETLKYEDGTETVINFTDPVDQSIPEEVPEESTEEVPEETVEPVAEVEPTPTADVESGETETADVD